MALIANTLSFASCLLLIDAVPTNVGCDFKVIPGKASATLNVMTTTGSIMGAPPTNSMNLAIASAANFSAGSTVSITFSNEFRMGFAHATAGTFAAPQFAGTPSNGASPCVGSQTIIYKDVFGATANIVWTAPSDVSAMTSVTLAFAGASGFGPISRRSITLTKSAAGVSPTASPVTGSTTGAPAVNKYRKINSGTCGSLGMTPITDVATCEAAATALQLSDVTATVRQDTPLPESCFYYRTATGNFLFLPNNSANVGKAAAANFEALCAVPDVPAVTPAPVTTTTLPSADRYKKLTTGSCSSNRMDLITDSVTCAGAVDALQLPVRNRNVVVTSITPYPEACFFLTDTLYFSTNVANAGNGASEPYEVICLKRLRDAPGAPKASNNLVIIVGAVGGALLLCLSGILLLCYRRRVANRTQKFEV
jgi:hypothetical protein